MKSNTQNTSTYGHISPTVKSAIVFTGLLSAASVTQFLNISTPSWRIPPQTPSDYGNILLASLTVSIFCISVWQLGWILLALIAKKSNSLSLRRLIHKCGTKGARALLSSSMVLTGFSGSAIAATPQDLHTIHTSMLAQSSSVLEKSIWFNGQQVSDTILPLDKTAALSDFTWGASTETPKIRPTDPNSQLDSTHTYRIIKGDSLWKIARNVLSQKTSKPSTQAINNYAKKLYILNRNAIGPNPDLIYPDMLLLLPPIDHSTPQSQSLEGTK